jgi:Mrp family chromosome partitioning ATPase
MDTTESMWETRREQWERELTVAEDGTDADTMAMEEAQAELDQAMMARARLLDHLNNIQRGQETDFDEMTVLTPASWQTTVTSDGKLKLFIVTLGGCLFVLVLPVFALEHFFPSGDPATHASRTLRIPCISRGTFVAGRLTRDPSSLQGVNSEAMRLLALRIQQSVHGSGSVVLFSGLNHEKSSIPMISYLAECLSRREERVLIIDACDRGDEANGRSDKADKIYSPLWPQQADRDAAAPQGAGQPTNGHDQQTHSARLPVNLQDHAEPGVLGLADLLHRRELPSEEMICATSISGVDIIPCGTTRFPREGMASSRLSALFDECRQRYTIILVAGPSTTHPSDLQMLSARADAILFTVPPSGCRAGHGEEVVRDLLDMGAPVIGIVS